MVGGLGAYSRGDRNFGLGRMVEGQAPHEDKTGTSPKPIRNPARFSPHRGPHKEGIQSLRLFGGLLSLPPASKVEQWNKARKHRRKSKVRERNSRAVFRFRKCRTPQ